MKIECDRVNDTFEQIFDGVYGYHKPYNHMTADLNGRVALITGASGMIGGAMLGLSVENGYVGEIDFAPNGLPTSHKKDHGVGLASVAATVKRYNGTLSIAAKDGVFSAHILLSL